MSNDLMCILWFGSGSRSLRILIRKCGFCIETSKDWMGHLVMSHFLSLLHHVWSYYSGWPDAKLIPLPLLILIYIYNLCAIACMLRNTTLILSQTQHQWRSRYFAGKTLLNPMHLLYRGLKGRPPWGIQQPGGQRCHQLCAIREKWGKGMERNKLDTHDNWGALKKHMSV